MTAPLAPQTAPSAVLDAPTSPADDVAILIAYLIALVVPPMWAYSMTPSPTLLNELLAVGGWGLCLIVHRSVPPMGARRNAIAVLALALALLCASVVMSWAFGSLPTSLALPPFALLACACAVAALGARVAQRAGPDGVDAFAPFAWGLVAVGVLSAVVAIIQVFLPDVPDTNIIARSGIAGRAVGNLRQPNHLASLLVWSIIALVPLMEWRKLPRWAGAAIGTLLIAGVILSGSRTGQYGGAIVLVLWGAIDWRLSRASRVMLLCSMAAGLVLWGGFALWSVSTNHTFGAMQRLSEGDTSHVAIWRNAIAMIGQQPWRGVGWGEFNFAWTLTPFPGRPVAFFDHTHDLPLQLMVELGLPLSLLVLGLLVWALWQGAQRAWSETGPAGQGARAAWVLVVMIAGHSLDEYPLWYAYFLLPAGWAFGFALGSGPVPRRRDADSNGDANGETTLVRLGSEGVLLSCIGVLMIAISVAAYFDYRRISTIFDDDDKLPPLEARIAHGQRSLLFAHHADYADATTKEPPTRALGALERATHSLIDTRLMIAWSTALAETGQRDRARYIVARLREFRKEDAAEFFAPCTDPAVKDKPFQCEPEPKGLTWRDFR